MFAVHCVQCLVQEQGHAQVKVEGGRVDAAGKGGVAIGIDQECHELDNKGGQSYHVGSKPTRDEFDLFICIQMEPSYIHLNAS